MIFGFIVGGNSTSLLVIFGFVFGCDGTSSSWLLLGIPVQVTVDAGVALFLLDVTRSVLAVAFLAIYGTSSGSAAHCCLDCIVHRLELIGLFGT